MELELKDETVRHTGKKTEKSGGGITVTLRIDVGKRVDSDKGRMNAEL